MVLGIKDNWSTCRGMHQLGAMNAGCDISSCQKQWNRDIHRTVINHTNIVLSLKSRSRITAVTKYIYFHSSHILKMLYTCSIYKCNVGLIPVLAVDAYGEARMKVEKKSNKRGDLCGLMMTMCPKTSSMIKLCNWSKKIRTKNKNKQKLLFFCNDYPGLANNKLNCL